MIPLNLVWFTAAGSMAQDRHFPAALGSGLPPLHSPVQGSRPPARPFRQANGRLSHPWGGWGGYPVDGGAGPAAVYPDVPPIVNSIFVIQPSSPGPPPEPIHSKILDVNLEAASGAEGAPPLYFVIALKSGSRLAAAVVWTQGNELRYVDAEDQNRRVPLAEVDRFATRTLNQARNLNLRLPPPEE